MDTTHDRPPTAIENPTADQPLLARRDYHALKVGIGLLGVILVAGLTELAWPGDNTLVVMRTALFLFAGGVAVALLGREIGRLRKAEGRYALVVAAADAGIWDWDALTDEMFVSERAQRLYGLQPEATLRPRSDWRALIRFHPEDVDAERVAFEDCLAGRMPTYDGEWRLHHGDGTYRWVRIRGRSVRDSTGRVTRMAGSVSDIDAKRRGQAALRFSEQRAALAMEASGDGHWDWNIPTDEFYGSPRMLEMYGVPRGTTFATRSEFVAQVPFHPEDHPKWQEAIDAHFAGKTARFDIEIRMILRGETRWIHQTGLLSRDTSGKPLRWTGAVADVTERKLAEEALRESEARFRNLTELSSDWYWQQDEDLRFTYLSRQADDLTGYTGQSSIGKKRWELENMTPVSGSWAEHQAVLAARQPFRDLELRRVGRDGVVRYLSISGAPIFDNQGRFQGYQGVGSDITPRKHAAEVLRESEIRFRTLAELSADWYWKQDENLRFTHSWSEFQELAGFPNDAWLGKTRWELPGIKLLSGSWREHQAVLEARQPFRDFEYCRIGPDGVASYMSVSGTPIFDQQGRFKGYEGIGRIITERKRIEKELRDSEARFRSLTELSSDWYWKQDEDLRCSYPSRPIARYSADMGLLWDQSAHGKTRWEIPDVQPLSSSWPEHQAVLAARQPFRDFEYSRLVPDGTIRYVSISGAPIFDEEGRFKGYQGVGRDITERKRIEQELRDSEARFRSLTELSSDWYWKQDEDLRFTSLSGSLAGYPAETSLGRTRWEIADVQPLSSSWPEHQAVLATRQPFRDFEYSRLAQDGTIRYVSISGAPIFDEEGRFKGYQGVGRDITERKRIEQELRDSEARFRSLTELSSDWYWEQDEDLRFTYLPDGLQAGYDAPANEFIGKHRWEIRTVTPLSSSSSSSWGEHQAVLAARQPFRDFEYSRLDPDGVIRYVSISGAPILDEEGRFKGYRGVGRNITERKQAEAALRESEARFRRLTKLSSDWYWRQDENLRFTHVWSELETQGYPALSSIGKTRWELAGIVKLLNTTWDEHKAVLQARQPFRDLEYSRMGPDGIVRYISISGVPIFDEEGRFKGYEGVGLNITERKRIEQDLRERQDILDVAQKAARAVAFEWRIGTGEGQNRWSPDLEAMYGLAPGSYDGSYDSWRKLVLSEDLPTVDAAIERAAETGEIDAEYRVVHPDARVHWVQAKGRIFLDDDGKPARVVGFMIDVSERHQAEIDETRFRGFFDLPLIGVGVSAPDRRFLDVNEKLAQILGYRREELIGRDWASITHPDDLAVNRTLLDGALSGETDTYSLDKRYIHRDGRIVYASISVCCVRRSDGIADHFVLTVQDVSEHHQAEEERRQLERQLRQAQRLEAMGTLAGGIAHDFNNILGAILGYGEMALRGAPRESRLRRDLNNIMIAGERGRALVERILAFSRSGVGERVAVHVERVVREALDQLAANLPANVTIFPRLRAGRAALLGDPTQVHQVLMNLATNAIQAMASGGTLRVSLARVRVDATRVALVGTLDAGDYVVLEVADTGVGIPADNLGRIFDPFFTTKEVGVGTGLGLSLVHGIVTELDGAIDVTSTVGTGSAFTVYLPYAGDAQEDRVHEEPEAPRGNRQQVLIVDDEAPLVGLARETLEELGYLPVAFTSSVAALEAFRAEPERFDAVITDERMPGMSGSALIRAIRGIRRAIPILLVSGYVGGEVTRRALESGADEVLKKPLSARQLATSLARVLST